MTCSRVHELCLSQSSLEYICALSMILKGMSDEREVYYKYPQEFSSLELSFSFLSKSWSVSADVLSFVYTERDTRIADLISCKSSTAEYPAHTRIVHSTFPTDLICVCFWVYNLSADNSPLWA